MSALIQRCASGTALCKRCASGTSLLRRCVACPACSCISADQVTVTLSGITSCAGVCYQYMLAAWKIDLLDGELNGSFQLPCIEDAACWWWLEYGSARVRQWSGSGGCVGEPLLDMTGPLRLAAHLHYATAPPRFDVLLGIRGDVGVGNYAFYGGLIGVPGQDCNELLGLEINNSLADCGFTSTQNMGFGGAAVVSL